MRLLIALLLIAALAILVALFLKVNSGYVLFVAPPYRVELSINAFVILACLAFAGVYVVLRVASRISRMPVEVRENRRRRNLERARNKQDSALVALLEGRYGRAKQFADEALAIPGSSGLAALVAARAALETRDFAVAQGYLGRADAAVPALAVPRLMLEAELALEQGQPGDALARLAELKREAGLHTAAQRLELRVLTAAGRHAEVPALVDQLVRRNVYDATQGELLRASALAEVLAGLRYDAAGLRAYWNRLPENDRTNPKVARAGATSFLALGGDREAAEIIAKCLERAWDPDLVRLYARCTAPGSRQLETAERWLVHHHQDASLLYALGRLCEREALWGKAQTYYEASLALDNHWRTQLALGELASRLDRPEQASAHLAAALKLALADLDQNSRPG